MTSPATTVGLIAKQDDPRAAQVLRAVVALLKARGETACIANDCRELLADADIPACPREALGTRCRMLIVVGGDGTMLGAARIAAPHGLPVVGVNAGRLGFLADITPDELERHLGPILAGACLEEHRLMLAAVRHTDDGSHELGIALNDVVIQKRDVGRMIEFESYVDGIFVCAHRADGLVIATPTGSTAYALSSGGPIVHPALDTLVLAPICPHTLSDRPIVIGGGSTVEVLLTSRGSVHAQVTLDGQTTAELGAGGRVRVTRAPHSLRLLHPPDHDYFRILRTKLRWGRAHDHDIGR